MAVECVCVVSFYDAYYEWDSYDAFTPGKGVVLNVACGDLFTYHSQEDIGSCGLFF